MKNSSLSFLTVLVTVFIFSPYLTSQIDVKNNNLMVHKTSTCGCCKEWMKHAENYGFNVSSKDYQNLEDIKKIMGYNPSIGLVTQQYLQMVMFLKDIYQVNMSNNSFLRSILMLLDFPFLECHWVLQVWKLVIDLCHMMF